MPTIEFIAIAASMCIIGQLRLHGGLFFEKSLSRG